MKHPGAAEPLIHLLDELRELTVRAGREDLSARVGMARARISDPRVRVVVVGPPRQGMSTLVNGLIGAEVSVTNAPNSIPVIVEYGDTLTATAIRAASSGRTERHRVEPSDPAAMLGQSAEGVVRVEFTVPHPLLAEGIVLMDAPGTHGDDPNRSTTTMSMLAAADAALYVSEAGVEHSPAEMAFLEQIRQVCPTVTCVLNKIDVYPQWSEVQQANRRRLDAAGLSFAIFPVSAGMRDYANRSGDRQLDVESGVPQLVDYLRQHVVARADQVARESVLNDIAAVSELLGMSLRTEADALRDPRRNAEITEKLRIARDNADQQRQLSSHWQVTLADGSAELMSDIEHDLRHRLRNLVRDAEAEIMKADPSRRWKAFEAGLDHRVVEAVRENFVITHRKSMDLASQVAVKFAADGRPANLPELRPPDADGVLEPVQPLEPLLSATFSLMEPFLAILRGSYAGLLMVGLATSLLDMPLVNWYSASAGALLGGQAFWDYTRTRQQRRQAEAKVAVARLMDDVVFQVSKESRYRLRAVQRTLRDHFSELANETLHSVDDSLRAAEEALNTHEGQRAARAAEITEHLDRLRALRHRAAAL